MAPSDAVHEDAGRRLRVVTTNDFIGSFFAQRTSYGGLPGAGGLVRAVEALREGVDCTVWIDTGDLFQGSALGPLTDGSWAFIATKTLGIDAGSLGNHDLDWGLGHLRRWARELPFPLLAANADLGFAPTSMLSTSTHEIGVIGITCPQMAQLHPGISARPDTAAIVKHHAARLRAANAHVVVLALHDGVDLVGTADGRAVVDRDRMAGLCASLDGTVDLVLGGHTLGCTSAS